MQTNPMLTQTLTIPAVRASGTLGYPTNRLISTFDDWSSLARAVNALATAGIDLADIEVLHGADGLDRLGIVGLRRLRLPELGPERDLLCAYRDVLGQGRYLLVLRQPGRLSQSLIEALTTNGGHAIYFFGRFAVHRFAP